MRTSLWLACAITFAVAAAAPAQHASVSADASVAALLQTHDAAMKERSMQPRRADTSDADRRAFLLGLGKWSTVVVSAVAGGAPLHSTAEVGWLNGRGGWVDGRAGSPDNSRGGGGWLDAR